MDCLFCKVAAGELKSDIVYSDDWVTAFRDINPKAPVHILLVPNEHIASIREVGPEHEALVGKMVRVASQLADREGIGSTGYRLVLNAGRDAGQSVDHLHLHLLGGRRLGWPPG